PRPALIAAYSSMVIAVGSARGRSSRRATRPRRRGRGRPGRSAPAPGEGIGRRYRAGPPQSSGGHAPGTVENLEGVRSAAVPVKRMDRPQFFGKLAALDDERLKKALWNLYWRGSAAMRERIEAEIDPQPERAERPARQT